MAAAARVRDLRPLHQIYTHREARCTVRRCVAAIAAVVQKSERERCGLEESSTYFRDGEMDRRKEFGEAVERRRGSAKMFCIHRYA